MNQQLRDTLSQLPHKPGVYQYYDANGDLLYVGKAKDLFKRVNSYWQNRATSPWTRLLVDEIDRVAVIEVNTELEALMLENSLVKALKPKYNIQLRDDKTFPFLRVSREILPTFSITRRVKTDQARYLGPFFSATYLRSLLKLLQELYGIKIGSEQSYESRSSVPKEIGLGARNLDSPTLYQQNVELAIKFISSPQPKMEKFVASAMHDAAKREEFERAARLRDRLATLEQLRNTQSLFSPGGLNRDYVGIERIGNLACAYILFEREGKILNHRYFLFSIPSVMPIELITEEIISYLYISGLNPPHEIALRIGLANAKHISDMLFRQTGYRTTLVMPKRAEWKKRIDTAIENARYQLHLESLKKTRRETGLAQLAELLQLRAIPKRIEAFDISNLGAKHIVGASIVFINGRPEKKEYRKYKIVTPSGQDDFASMRELVFRRLRNSERTLPDLLLIDGGQGQLSAALDAIRLSNVQVPVVAIAKKEELLYLPYKREAITLPKSGDALLLLTAIRDEVHRFVISFHRQRRAKAFLP